MKLNEEEIRQKIDELNDLAFLIQNHDDGSGFVDLHYDAVAKIICYLAILSNGIKLPEGEVIQCPEQIYQFLARNLSSFIYSTEYNSNDVNDKDIFPLKRISGITMEAPEWAKSDNFKHWLQMLSSIDSMKQIVSTDPKLIVFAKDKFNIDITKSIELDKEGVKQLTDYEKNTKPKPLNSSISSIQTEDFIDFVYDYVSNKLPDIQFQRKPLEDFFKYSVNNGRVLDELKRMLRDKKANNSKHNISEFVFVLDAMFTLHDSWVSEHSIELDVTNKETIDKFLPSELIGFERLTKYYSIVNDFIKRLFNDTLYYINVTSLEDAYNLRVKEYYLKNHIISNEDTAKMLSEGSLSYEPLGLAERYNEYLAQSEGSSITFEEYCKTITNSLPIDETRRNIADKILTDPNASEKDVKRLTAAEIARRLNETIRLADITSLLQHLNNDPKVIAANQRRNDLSSNEKNEESYQQ